MDPAMTVANTATGATGTVLGAWIRAGGGRPRPGEQSPPANAGYPPPDNEAEGGWSAGLQRLDGQ
jgi:hypothetical protein